MGEPEGLANLIRWVGVIVALLASFLAAPDATWHIIKKIAEGTSSAASYTGEQTGKLWDHLLGKATPSVTGMAAVLGPAPVGGRTGDVTWQVDADAHLRSRVGWIEQRVLNLFEIAHLVQQKMTTRGREARRAGEEVGRRLADEVAAIHRRTDAQEEALTRVDARALPVVGVGIVLSGIPEPLAQYGWFGILSIGIAVLVLVLAIVHFVRTLPPRAGGSPRADLAPTPRRSLRPE